MSTYNIFHDWYLRLRHPLAGLNTTPQRWSDRTVVAARHYPHLLCWSWFLERHDELGKRKFVFFRHGAGGSIVIGRWQLWWQHYRIRTLRTGEAP